MNEFPPRRPALIVLSGPSGAGKDSVLQEVRRLLPDVCYTVTSTTRPPRPHEVDGTDYHFVDPDTYARLLDAGELLAPADVHGYWYGAPLGEIRDALARSKDVLLKVDVKGAMDVQRRIPQAVFVFLAPPSMEEMVARLKARHTEKPEELARRIADARFEMDQLLRYDYLVVNCDLPRAVQDVVSIVVAERLRLHRQPIDFGAY